MIDERVDVKENNIVSMSPELLEILLLDRTTGKNIIWATDNYVSFGKMYQPKKEIKIESITGHNGNIIKPRTKKSKKEQEFRTKEKAEVFTPSWICNSQNNLIDNERLYKNAFNKEKEKYWIATKEKIKFKKDFTWQDYVKSNVLEITCGEAPYLVSRYDTVTGDVIQTHNRIGLLDRKLRVINENVLKKDRDKWVEYVEKAYKHTYGYEWQGDSLLIARENLLYTFKDYYLERFNEEPNIKELKTIAEIISWNIWQMDGLKGVVPLSCKKEKVNDEVDMFDYIKSLNGEKTSKKNKLKACKGCKENDITKHNGIYCKIKDWEKNEVIKFINLMNR